MLFGLKKATVSRYNAILGRLRAMATDSGSPWPPTHDQMVMLMATLMEQQTRTSARPQSILRTISAAVGHLYAGPGQLNPANSPQLALLRRGINRQRTTRMTQTGGVVEAHMLVPLFRGPWANNDSITLRELRAKLTALLCFVAMYRPSDAVLPRLKHVRLAPDDSAMRICLLGYKTDLDANGVEHVIHASSDPALCPVRAARAFIKRTAHLRRNGADSFLLLRLDKPSEPLVSSTVSNILRFVIQEAGYDPKLWTPRTFRRGGATAAIAANQNPDQVMKLGRWKTPEVFYGHYVRGAVPPEYTDAVLGVAN